MLQGFQEAGGPSPVGGGQVLDAEGLNAPSPVGLFPLCPSPSHFHWVKVAFPVAFQLGSYLIGLKS